MEILVHQINSKCCLNNINVVLYIKPFYITKDLKEIYSKLIKLTFYTTHKFKGKKSEN